MGTVDECVAQLEAHLAAGVQKIIFVPYRYQMDQIETIARDIIPRLKAGLTPQGGQDLHTTSLRRRTRRCPSNESKCKESENSMSDKARQDVLAMIDRNRDNAVAFLQKMVSIPSVTGDEAAIQAYLAKYLRDIGLAVDMWETDWEALKKHPGYRPVAMGYEGRPNIVATWKGTGGGRSLLLNGHTDVIPVGNGEGWSDNPWSASIKNGRIYGRGSCDMKSGVASHILAVEYLKAAGLRPKGDVLINIVIDEEVSGHGTLDTVIRGYKADAGISGETSDLAVQPACIGRIWFEIEIHGKPAGIQKRYRA